MIELRLLGALLVQNAVAHFEVVERHLEWRCQNDIPIIGKFRAEALVCNVWSGSNKGTAKEERDSLWWVGVLLCVPRLQGFAGYH